MCVDFEMLEVGVNHPRTHRRGWFTGLLRYPVGTYYLVFQEPTGPSEQSIRTCYLGHVTGYQPIRDFLVQTAPWLVGVALLE